MRSNGGHTTKLFPSHKENKMAKREMTLHAKTKLKISKFHHNAIQN
jgi:hypothetical protein